MCFLKLKCQPDIFLSAFQFDPLTIESKKAATVVLMLNSPEEEILAKACEAIYRFALKGLDFFQFIYFISCLRYLLHKGHFSHESLTNFLSGEFFQTTRISFNAIPKSNVSP